MTFPPHFPICIYMAQCFPPQFNTCDAAFLWKMYSVTFSVESTNIGQAEDLIVFLPYPPPHPPSMNMLLFFASQCKHLTPIQNVMMCHCPRVFNIVLLHHLNVLLWPLWRAGLVETIAHVGVCFIFIVGFSMEHKPLSDIKKCSISLCVNCHGSEL